MLGMRTVFKLKFKGCVRAGMMVSSLGKVHSVDKKPR